MSSKELLARSPRRLLATLALVIFASVVTGILAYSAQATQNRADADERFAALSQRVTHGIAERLRRYEYGLRGTRGVAVASGGAVTREAFSRYSASRQIDREFPGARGFGIVYRVTPADEVAFVRARRNGDMPGFSIRALAPHAGDRFVITYVEPIARNQEAIGLDIASEPARRDAALQSAKTSEATLTAPITLVQAGGKKSGGLLLLLPIRRVVEDEQSELVGWSYAPLLIEDILRGLDAEEDHFALSLFDLDDGSHSSFYTTGKDSLLAPDLEEQRIPVSLYGRRWEASLRPTAAFVQSLHQASPWSEAIKAMLLGGAVAALLATAVQLVNRTRGQRLELARRAAIVDGSDDAIVVQGFDGTITDWNDGATRLFGFSRAEAVGRTATDLLVPPELASEDEALRSTVARGDRVHAFETARRGRDGSDIAVSITASPIRDADGAVVGSAKILRDIRAAKAATQRMRDLNASLEDQVRERTALLDEAMREAREANQAKSRFLANVSHEIRTPMNAVIGLSHMLGRTQLDDDQTTMLANIRTAGKALMALLNDVLDLSKIEAGEMPIEAIPFRLEDVLDEVSSIVGVSAAQRGIAFSVSKQGDVPGPLIGDSMRLVQILLNLLSNAIKFTPHGGVELAAQVGSLSPAGLVPVSFRVTDTGIGIPEDVQRRLFQPFVQADASTTRKFGGTGLGLSIVRQLVELFGGKIQLTSFPGRGSTFQIDLAFAIAPTGSEPMAQDRGVHVPSYSVSGLRVLVVDDNALNREVADRILRGDGAVVILASNGRDALDLLDSADTSPDVVLMDVQMPVMDGLEATRQIRSKPGLERLPVIGLTAGVSSEERRHALDAGMDAVVGKPFDPDSLLATIFRLVNRIAEPLQEASPKPPPASMPADWPDVEGLDQAKTFRTLKGDRELLARMQVALAGMLEANEAVLTTAAPPAHWHASHAKLLHDLKAIAGTLGATRLQAASGQAERLLRLGRWDEAIVEISNVAELGRPLMDACAKASVVPRPANTQGMASPSTDLELLFSFVAQLESQDLAALSACGAIQEALRVMLGGARALQVTDLVQTLDFEGALTIIRMEGWPTRLSRSRPSPAQQTCRFWPSTPTSFLRVPSLQVDTPS